MRRAVGALMALGLVIGLLGTAVVGSAMAMFGMDVQPTATSAATPKIPPAMLALYQEAATTCSVGTSDTQKEQLAVSRSPSFEGWYYPASEVS